MKLLDPKIEIPDIEVKLDDNIDEPVENIVRNWGPRFPVISINGKTMPLGTVTGYTLRIGINSLPQFTISLSDSEGELKNELNDDVYDTCVIFIGEQKWYRKYQGIILNTFGSGDSLSMSGILFNEKFYNNIQESFKELSVKDVITKLCTDMGLGLFAFENNNNDLSKVFNAINPGERSLGFLLDYIRKYTNNIYCIDDSYFLHVGSIDSMREQPVDTYTIKAGEFFDEPKEIILTNLLYDINDPEGTQPNYKLHYNNYSLAGNIGNSQLNFSKEYILNSSIKLKTVESELGFGEKNSNIFKPFEDRYNPFYNERLERDLTGKSITLSMNDNLLEISPFQIINLELYKDSEVDENSLPVIDDKHSGKKIIISYDESYSQDSNSDNKYIQNITVI